MNDITRLDPAMPLSAPEPFAGPDHPMRKLTRQVAFDGAWGPERAAKVGELFDSMAAEWAERIDEVKVAPVADALDRAPLRLDGRWLELGSGTGAGTTVLAPRVGAAVAVDLSAEMLRHAPELAPRAQADSVTLPFADSTFDGLLLVNMLLFPAEVDRILRPEGTLLWVNSLGDQTPIHLPVEDVIAALPGRWKATSSEAGTGFWAAVQRA